MHGIGQAIGDLLPSAIGVALSPVPIIASVLLLMSAAARKTAPAFAVGWVVGLLVATLVVILVADPAGADSSGGSTWVGALKIALGALFLFMALKQWKSRPKEGQQPELPKWMDLIDRMSAARAFGLGALLSGANPKNLTLAVAAALSISQADLSPGATAVTVAVFLVLGSVTVAGPVLGYLALRDRIQAPLLAAKDWLVRENATVMYVVLLVLGVVMIGKGISTL